MIVWRLRGGTGCDGDVVCSIEKWRCAYRLLVEHGGAVQVDESHPSMDTARAKAEALRKELAGSGFGLVVGDS